MPRCCLCPGLYGIVIFLTVVHPKLNNNVIKLVICIPPDKIMDSRNPQISAPLGAIEASHTHAIIPRLCGCGPSNFGFGERRGFKRACARAREPREFTRALARPLNQGGVCPEKASGFQLILQHKKNQDLKIWDHHPTTLFGRPGTESHGIFSRSPWYHTIFFMFRGIGKVTPPLRPMLTANFFF